MRRDRAAALAVARWFRANARPLPWRTAAREPYLALVSEAMLQQTQVSRVVEKFAPFIERFPSVEALAGADEQEVLALWSGLGYYRRARSLHAAAKRIVELHGGRVPGDAEALRELPGVGRYTAGAIASIVFGAPEPIVDGNVLRVLLRVEGRDGAADDPASVAWAWERARALADAAHGAGEVGAFNEGMMELGATVCTPAGPRCDACPLRDLCVARREGRTGEIPAPKAAPVRTVVHHACGIVEDAEGRLLVERRPETGLWAGLWQPVTLESGGRAPSRAKLAARVGAVLGGPAPALRAVGAFAFGTTHRDVRFTVYGGRVDAAGAGRLDGAVHRWLAPGEIAGLPLANPHRRMLLEPGTIGAGAGRRRRAGVAGGG